MTAIEVVPAPYKRVGTQTVSEGKCIECGGGADVSYRFYRNLETNEEFSIRVRSSCSCSGEYDPYKQYEKPLPRWSHPGEPHHPDGHYLQPEWVGDHWELK